jgi:hypothetical protein
MKWWTLSLVLALAATSAEAQIYKWIMPDGTVKYSDRPQEEGAEPVELSPTVTYTPTPVPRKPEAAAPDEEAQEGPGGYDSFSISAPPNDTTVRDNAGNVTVNFAVTPSLAEGHAIDLYMDGRKFGQSKLPVVTLTNVNRGTHQIYGAIVDASGAELARTEPVTVHLQRVSAAGGGATPSPLPAPRRASPR